MKLDTTLSQHEELKLEVGGLPYHVSRDRLRGLLDTGATITQTDVDEAERVAWENSGLDNLVLYARLKSVKQAQEDGTYTLPTPPEPPKVTAEDVEAARVKAQRTSSTRDIADYAVLKRQYQTVEEAGA